MTKPLVLISILILAGMLGGCEPSLQPGGEGQPAAAALSPSAEVSSDQQAPKLFLVEPEYDAGKVRKGDVVKHTFVVQNRGLGQLNIEKVKGS